MDKIVVVLDGIVHNPIRATIALAMAVILALTLIFLTHQISMPLNALVSLWHGSAQPTPRQLSEAKYHFQQGLTFASMGRVDEGIQEFTAAIGLDSNYAAAYGNRGVAYMMQKKYNKALEDLNNAVRFDATNRNALYNLAALHTLRQEFDLAIDALDQALKRGFDNYDALRRDADLEGLRRQPEFRKLLERHRISL
jgi:tetratricopeptide (TPR) repeat protein